MALIADSTLQFNFINRESKKHISVETKFKLKNKMVYMIICDKKGRDYQLGFGFS